MNARLARVRRLGARTLDRAVEHTWLVLAAWSAVLGLSHLNSFSAVSWHSFVTGTHVLFSGSAAHLYSEHSALQIGPVTYVVIAPVVEVLPATLARWVAMALLSAAGLLVLGQLRRLAPARDPACGRRLLLGGAAMVTVWSQLAITYTHPDDALALLLGVLALRVVCAGHPVAAAVMLGLAADCKPWALAFVAVLLIAERRRVGALLAWCATVAGAWLPFYLADPASSAAARFRIPNVATSSLRVLGVHASGTPIWDRPAQVLLGATLGLVAVRRGRWPAVILMAVCARLLLDPGTKSYYDAGLLVGSMLVDLVLLAGPAPVFTLSALLLFSLPRAVQGSEPHLYGLLRTAYLLVVIGAVLVGPRLQPRRRLALAVAFRGRRSGAAGG